jgi:hypothetical protein
MRDAGSPGESHAELTPDQAASVEDILAQLEQDGRSTAADEQAGSDDDSRPKGPFEETTPSGVHRGTTPGGQEKRDSDTDGGFLEQVVREANAKKAKSKLKSSQSNLEPVQPSDPKLKRAKLRRKKNVIETDQRANDSGSSQRPADIERELKPKRGTPQDRYQRTESFKSRTPTRPVPGRVGETIRATGGRIDRESAGAGQKLTNQSTPPRNPPPDKAKDKRTPDRAAEAHAGRRGTSSPSKLQGSNARTKKDSAEAASRNPRDKPASRVPETAPRQPRVTQTNPDQASQPQTAPRQPRVTQTNPDQTGKPKVRVVGQPRVTVGSPTSSPGATVRVAASPSAGQQTTSGSPKVRIDPQGGRRPDGENPESGPVVQPTPPVAGGEASKRPGGTGDKSGGRGHRSDASGRKKKTGTAKRPESASTK